MQFHMISLYLGCQLDWVHVTEECRALCWDACTVGGLLNVHNSALVYSQKVLLTHVMHWMIQWIGYVCQYER